MAEMEHYPNFQKDNYIHPKAAWDKLRMAGARRQNVYLYAATGYGKTELLHRYLRRRRHIWLSRGCGSFWRAAARCPAG